MLFPFGVEDLKAKLERSWVGAFAGLICPPTCVCCNVPLKPNSYLCGRCANKVRPMRQPYCRICSEPFHGAINGVFACSTCEDRQFVFACAVSRYRLRGNVRELIVRFKYQRQHYLRRPLSRWLAEALDDERIRCQSVDALVPVPLHPRRQRERGFNQAEALCRSLSRRANLPVWPALRRVRYTETQTHFERAERLENLRGAFAVRYRKSLGNKHLLLVDDVFTTGSTVDECARTLRAAGAASVRVLTVARA